MRKSWIIIFIVFLLQPFLQIKGVNLDYPFIVMDGRIYRVVVEEEVSTDLIGKSVGRVSALIDESDSIKGNASNFYPVGTKYHIIYDTDPRKVLAVADDGKFKKAIYQMDIPFHWSTLVYNFIPFLFLGCLIVLHVRKEKYRKQVRRER